MTRTFLAASMMGLLLIGVFTVSAGAVEYPGGSYLGGPRADITYLTFGARTRVPGATLEPGTYEFRRMLPRFIQVVSKDHSTVYTMFTTIPRYRTETLHEDAMVFGEASVGTPRALEIWFPAHLRVGDEFVYPRNSH